MGRTADFSQLGYKVIPAGDYEVEVMSYEWKDPKPKANAAIDPDTNKPYQYANVKIQVTELTDTNGDEVEGHVLFDKFSANPKSLFVLKRSAIAFGDDPELFVPERDANGRAMPLRLDLDEILGRMVGRRALATVAIREYTNDDGDTTQSNEIKTYSSVEQPTAVSASRR